MNQRRTRPRIQPGQRTSRDVATGIAALIALITLVVGLPLLLSIVAPLHLPAQVPTIEQLRDTLAGPDDGTLFLGFLTVIAWTGWAWLLLAVLVEVTAAVRGLPARRHAGLSLAQPVAASLVTAVTLLLSTSAGQAGAPAPATRAVATTLHEVPAAFTTPLTAPAPAPDPSPRPPAGATTPPGTTGASRPAASQSSGPVLEVTVRRGDTLWSLAETHLGDGTRYRQIAQANYGRPQGDGRSLTDAHWIYPGWVLRIPGATTDTPATEPTRPRSPDQEPADSSETTYVVRSGDTLWDIAAEHLGDPAEYPRIARASRDIVQDDGTRLRDPDLIRPDWRLRIPGDPAGSGQDPAREHPAHHDEQERPGRPDEQTPQPTPAPSPGPSGQPHASSPAGLPVPTIAPPTAIPPAAQPIPSPPAPTPPAPSGAAGGAAGVPVLPLTAPTPQVPPDPGGPGPAEPEHPDAQVRSGVDVPGGWMDYPLAAALVSLIALVWARRRHRHAYTPTDLLTPPGEGDDDLAELPDVLTRSRSVVRAHAPALLEEVEPGPTVAEYLGAKRAGAEGVSTGDPGWVLSPPGPHGLDLAGLSSHDDCGIGLVGPGAVDAARALVVAALAAGGAEDVWAWTHLVIPTALATGLLTPTPARNDDTDPVDAEVADAVGSPTDGHRPPVVPEVLDGIERVELVEDLTAALDHLEREAAERRATLAFYQVGDREALIEADPLAEFLPPLVLLTQAPPPGLVQRLAAVAAQGAPVGISVVVLGPWAPGVTWDIDTDGHLAGQNHPRQDADPQVPDAPGHTESPVRVAVLDLDAARDALSVVREAHTGVPASDPSGPDTGAGRDHVAAIRGLAPPAPSSTDHAAPVPATASAPGQATQPGADQPAPGTTAEDQRVQVRVLGPPVILDRDGTPVARVRSGAIELLVLLAVHRSGLPLREVKAALWPTASVKQADKRLSTEAASLRGAIRRVIDDQDAQPVINTGGHYHLDPDLVRVDLWEFTDTLRQATTPTRAEHPDPTTGPATTDPAATDPAGQRAQRIAVLRRALDIAAGQTLAADTTYEWITPAREHLRRLLLRAHLHLVDQLTRDDQRVEAAEVALAAVDLDPTNEDITRTAMTALAGAGRHAEIPALLQRLHAALDELDLEPDEETTTLAQQLRQPPPAGNLRAV
ncbi:MAG: LysM peptidoglycan-binding domain-containing protein [Actinomycetales bacterium]|nr:LysM peptidoglycan-binding domain-containing protein [Actinomycetales bacterium]